jgi:hypothetical protein
MDPPGRTTASVLELLRRFGADAVSFLALEPGMRHWVDPDGEACVAYADTGSAWVAAGAPVAAEAALPRAALDFVRLASSKGRRASFFATEGQEIPGFDRLLIGQQPVWQPGDWPGIVRRHRRLREQLRRAAAKGVRVRRVDASELAEGLPLRAQWDALTTEWLASRHLAPMAFLVDLKPFCFAEEHRYLVAERGDRVLAFLSAVPVYAGGGWLIEDMPRGPLAPNGTVELLIDGAMSDLAGSRFVTLGLAPLAGPVNVWLRAARFIGRPLYDFRGLASFKRRLHPSHWNNVWLAYPRSESATVHVLESLRAFAQGSLVRFGLRSIARHPSGPAWALALPLVPWTLLLAILVVSGRSDLMGFSRGALLAWAIFDALLAVQLFHSAVRPRMARLACSALPAWGDAALSLRHLWLRGFGVTALCGALRGIGTIAPCLGAAVLTWATAQATVASVRRARI